MADSSMLFAPKAFFTLLAIGGVWFLMNNLTLWRWHQGYAVGGLKDRMMDLVARKATKIEKAPLALVDEALAILESMIEGET